jgi:hypothetical protein
MSESQSSDAMHNLVKFIICLAIAGTVIALVAYFMVALPGQQAAALSAPSNSMYCFLPNACMYY